MKLLVTGGAGFLGTNIALTALDRGYEVVIMDNFVRRGSENNAKTLEKLGAKVIHGEVRLQQDWDDLPSVDAVCHLAGQPGIPKSLENPVLDFHVNAVGTLNGLEYAKKRGKIPFVYASTNKIYSDVVNQIKLKEEDTRYSFDYGFYGHEAPTGLTENGIEESFPMDSAGEHPHSPYGVSKASGDLLTQEYYHAFGVPTTALRMSCIYGLYQNGVSEQGWTDYFIRQRLGDNKLIFYGNGKQVRDCLFGTDAAEAYLMCIEKNDIARGKVYNLGGGKFNSSLIEWVDILNKYENKEPMNITYDDWRLADHRVYISDTSKIERELGWKAKVNIEEGIDRCIKAYASR